MSGDYKDAAWFLMRLADNGVTLKDLRAASQSTEFMRTIADTIKSTVGLGPKLGQYIGALSLEMDLERKLVACGIIYVRDLVAKSAAELFDEGFIIEEIEEINVALLEMGLRLKGASS